MMEEESQKEVKGEAELDNNMKVDDIENSDAQQSPNNNELTEGEEVSSTTTTICDEEEVTGLGEEIKDDVEMTNNVTVIENDTQEKEDEEIAPVSTSDEGVTESQSEIKNDVEMDSTKVIEDDGTLSIKQEEEAEPDLLELLNRDVSVYEIPTDKASHKAADWDLANPVWTGILRLLSSDNYCILKLEESDAPGVLYGQTKISKYPRDSNFQSVSDSTRYFVIKITQGESLKSVGIAFYDREDSKKLKQELGNYFIKLPIPLTQLKREADSQLVEKPSKVAKRGSTEFTIDSASPISQQLLYTPDTLKKVNEEEESAAAKPLTKVAEMNFLRKGQGRPGQFVCHICSATFDDMRYIKCHWHRIHKLLHPAHCVVCKLPFPTPQLMNEHRFNVHGFTCPTCNKMFKKAHGLESHFLQVHGEEIHYDCQHCDEHFGKREDLKTHLGCTHFNDDGSSVLFICDFCPERFITEKELEGHALTHDRNVLCEYCDERLHSKNQLRKHLITAHNGAKQSRI